MYNIAAVSQGSMTDPRLSIDDAHSLGWMQPPACKPEEIG
jgi:hypothetical protein